MYDHTVKNLIDFGLSVKEAKIYITLLELGTATAFEVASRSGVNRSSTYVVLEALSKRGLAGLSGGEKVRRYTAVSPEALAQMSHVTAKKHEQVAINIKSILPELSALHRNVEIRPRIRTFDGTQGLIYAMTEFLSTDEKVLRAFSSGENIMKLPMPFIVKWATQRVKNKIELKSMFLDNEASKKLVASYPLMYKAVYVLSKDYPVQFDMMIDSNKVAYLVVNGDKTTVIIIDSREIGSVMKGVFDMAFQEARRRGGKYQEG